MRRELILGPPGTGKTTRLLAEIVKLRDQGYRLSEIGFASFTRRAIHESLERGGAALDCSEDELPWFRTLHSAFTAATGVKSFVNHEALQEFRELHGYELSDEKVAYHVEQGRSHVASVKDDDNLRRVVDFARSKLCTIDQAMLATGSREHVGHVKRFAERYRAWMRTTGRWDFTGVIEEAVERGTTIPVRAIIVDEAQDLSPLQVRALQPTIDQAEVVIVAGDDDQAIFGFQGADHRWIGSLATSRGWGVETLSQSWRVPERVHAVAQRIIARNRLRVEKSYRPRPEPGEFERHAGNVVERLENSPGTRALLARHRAGTAEVARALYERAVVPYRLVNGLGPNPLAKENMAGAVTTMDKLTRGEPVGRVELVKMLDFVKVGELVPYKLKTKLKDLQEQTLGPDRLDEFGLGVLRAAARRDGLTAHFTLKGTTADDRRWFGEMWRRYGKIPEPEVTLSTIHSTKGGEWDTVVIVPDHNKAVERNLTGEREAREAEHRVAYVGATRARHSLIIARKSGPRAFDY